MSTLSTSPNLRPLQYSVLTELSVTILLELVVDSLT